MVQGLARKNSLMFMSLFVFFSELVASIKQGNIQNAECLWHQMDRSGLHPSVWYQMMKLYKNKGNEHQVMELYKKYLALNDESEPDEFFFNLVMRLNPTIMNDPKNKDIYSKICQFIEQKMDAKQSDEYLTNSLLGYYAKINDLNGVIDTFDKMDVKHKNKFTYGDLMRTYLNNNMSKQVVEIFFSNEMLYNKKLRMMSDINYVLALKACCNINDEENGKKIHNLISHNTKYNGKHSIELMTSLLTFYGKIGEIETASKIFDEIHDGKINVVCYNAMMQAYLDNHMNKQVIKLFFSNKILDPDDVSCLVALKACSNMKDKENGKKIHNLILQNTKYTTCQNIELFTTLIKFYGKIGEIEEASKIFCSIIDKDVACYGAMMQAYLDNRMNKEVIGLFFSKQMFYATPKMINHVTCMLALKACGNAKSYYTQVEEMDNFIHDKKDFFQDSWLVSQLICCYGKLGYIDKSEKIFDKYLQLFDNDTNSVIMFSNMIHSYGRNRLGGEAIKIFLRLKNEAIYSQQFNESIASLKMQDIEAVSGLYISLICACSHSGLPIEAHKFYQEYDDYYRIVGSKLKSKEKLAVLDVQRSTAHCALVDAFARKGLLDQAWQFCVEFEGNIQSEVSFLALLGGCRKYNKQDMAEKTWAQVERLILSDSDKHSRAYSQSMMASSSVLMHNILFAEGKYDEANTIDQRRKMEGWHKRRGVSEIVIPGDDIGVVHSFSAGNDYKKDYPNDWRKMDQLWNKWKVELTKHGFKHDHKSMTRQLKGNETVEYVLCRHAEKLALAYGILKITDKNVIIHINKNMRMCPDCHEATKRIAQIERREIRVADAHVIHIFDGNGNCSCADDY